MLTGFWFRLRFGLTVFVGFVLICTWPLYFRTTSCEQHLQHTEAKESDRQPLSKQSGTDQTYEPFTTAKQTQPNSYLQAAYNLARSWLCEPDFKITDLALVFFTYSLVIVGWFTLRSNERTMREIERAHIFCYIANFGPDPAVAILVSPKNTGRTPGVVKAIAGRFSSHRPKWHATYRGAELHPRDLLLSPDEKATEGAAHFPSTLIGPQWFYGYVQYVDIFRARHITRFCVRVDQGIAIVTPDGPRRLNSYS